MRHAQRHQSGFTLVELIMVIVILGVISTTVVVFVKPAVDAYFDTLRRTALSDAADTALRRIARDLHKSLPNSIRSSAGNCIEFIPTRTGGRYRTEGSGALDFSLADTSFNMLGQNGALPADQQIRAGDVIAVYNLGISGASAYDGDNTATVSSVVNGSETTINLNPGKQFPLRSGSNRFHVIPGDEAIVSYVCSGNTLYRNANYGYASTCPAPGSGTPVLASNVAACSFTYSGSDLLRNALVQISLTLTDSSGESVRLYSEVHVNNTP